MLKNNVVSVLSAYLRHYYEPHGIHLNKKSQFNLKRSNSGKESGKNQTMITVNRGSLGQTEGPGSGQIGTISTYRERHRQICFINDVLRCLSKPLIIARHCAMVLIETVDDREDRCKSAVGELILGTEQMSQWNER